MLKKTKMNFSNYVAFTADQQGVKESKKNSAEKQTGDGNLFCK